ncbi:MAG: magnesium transporter [Phycisphaeraceae bacterium]|nr:magnesium transporter [Phycisphaeraceae bacterium]
MAGGPADQVERDDLSANEQSQDVVARFQAVDLGPDATRAFFGTLNQDEAARVLEGLTEDTRAREVLLWLPREQSGLILASIDPSNAARLVAELPSDERADILAAVEEERRAAIQAMLPVGVRHDAAKLLSYEPDTAGGLMETEFVAYSAKATVSDAIRDLRANQQKYAVIGVQYLYLLDEAGKLVGVAPIRDLMLAAEDSPLARLSVREPASVRDVATLHEVAAVFDEHPYLALPVVDGAGKMLGVVSRADATEGEQEEAEDDYRLSQGIVGGEELRSMPVGTRLRRRSAWLGVNLILCLGGAAIVAFNRDTIAKAIVVAAVLPVISATSGNAAMQAAAVSIRELTLGVIDPAAWRRVLMHELGLAGLIAVPLGGAVAVLSNLWGASWSIGAAVGTAMTLNAVIAIAIGAICPLLLRRLSVDPALASGPITTTLADVSGFALTLGLVAIAT